MKQELRERIETELEVKAYLQNLRYALDSGARIDFQENRYVDELRDERYTNQYTLKTLFPFEKWSDVLKRELRTLTVENYIRTVRDLRFPSRTEMREFGKKYDGTEDVYIKIRVELLGEYGIPTTFVMSFHVAQKKFRNETFPYKKGENL